MRSLIVLLALVFGSAAYADSVTWAGYLTIDNVRTQHSGGFEWDGLFDDNGGVTWRDGDYSGWYTPFGLDATYGVFTFKSWEQGRITSWCVEVTEQNPVPEPATLIAVSVGLCVIVYWRRRSSPSR